MLLSLRQLTIRFQGLIAVNNLDLDIAEGSIFSLIGPNGAGKTTVFNAITGVCSRSGGRIFLGGKRLSQELSPARVALFCAIALATGMFAALTYNIEALWTATVTSLYVYQEAFPWREAFAHGRDYVLDQSAISFWSAFFIGAVVGGTGSVVVWQRSRLRSDVIARRGIARTFQNIRLFQQLTALENVLVALDTHRQRTFLGALFRTRHFRRSELRTIASARELLRFVGLDGDADTLARNLDYGHQRRLEIARALGTEPKLLLLDEPAAGMNPSEAQELLRLIRSIRDRGITVLMIEHHMRLVMAISDRIAVLDYGNKIAEGLPEEVRSNPAVIRAYLGAAS